MFRRCRLPFLAGIPTIVIECFRYFPQPLQEYAWAVHLIKSQPLPFPSFPIHYSRTNLSREATQFKILDHRRIVTYRFTIWGDIRSVVATFCGKLTNSPLTALQYAVTYVALHYIVCVINSKESFLIIKPTRCTKSPTRDCKTLTMVVGLVWSNELWSYAGGSVATGRASHARLIRDENLD
jgi:hypothetical protein